MNLLIVDRESSWTFQFNDRNFSNLSELRERIVSSLDCMEIPEYNAHDLNMLIVHIDRVKLGNYTEGSGHCDRFGVYAILL